MSWVVADQGVLVVVIMLCMYSVYLQAIASSAA